MGEPTKKKYMRRSTLPAAYELPGSNCKIFEANIRRARVISGYTAEAIYEVINRVLEKALPAEMRKASAEHGTELGGEGG